MKVVYFAEPMPEILYTGDKTATFRVTDRQDIRPHDELSLRLLSLTEKYTEFARVMCTLTKQTRFQDLTEEDWEGHERFESEKEMLETYSNWERKPITMSTGLKIIRFEYKTFHSELLERYRSQNKN